MGLGGIILDVEPRDPMVDAVFDIRTGYHVITKPAGHFDDHSDGEGNPEIFTIIRGPAFRLGEANFWREEEYELTLPNEPDKKELVPIRKLDLALHKAQRGGFRDGVSKLKNVYREQALVTEDGGTREDFLASVRLHDTFKNAVLTVGTGKTYAAINTARAAASSGDCVAVFAGGASNVYAENVIDNGLHIQIVGMVAKQGITIKPSAGTHCIRLTGFSEARNFTVTTSGSTQQGVTPSTWADVRDVIAHTIAYGFNFSGATNQITNCLAYNCTTNGYRLENSSLIRHCSAVDCGTGFNGAGGGSAQVRGCLAAGNTTDFGGSVHATLSMWNVSGDGTAPGISPQTGFNTADFTNYAGDDFTLGTTNTQAKFNGEPLTPLDGKAQTRKRYRQNNVFYAGWSDPDPDVGPDVPTLTAVDAEDDKSFVVTFDGDAGVTNHLVYKPKSAVGWVTGQNRAGDGDITVSPGPGTYELYGYSELSNLFSDPSEVIEVQVDGAGLQDSPVGQLWWKWYKYNRVTGVWVFEGNFIAPIQEVPIRDGRAANMTVQIAANGKKLVTHHPHRSNQGEIRMEWFEEKSGADSWMIFQKLNEWVKTGAELKIETHVPGVEYMGAFKSNPRLLLRSYASEQKYKPTASFELYPVDGTGAGW